MTALEAPARCVVYSPSGDRLAVGFGCPAKKTAKQPDGKWVVLGAGDFGVQAAGTTDGKKPLTCTAWSPSGAVLCFGSLDNKVYLYNANDGFALKGAAVSHDSPIRSVDFSTNSQYLATTCSGFCLCFVEADSGAAVRDVAKLRDVKWASCTGPMQWAAQGVWPPQNDGTDVLTCDALHMDPRSSGGGGGAQAGVLATGDSFGRLKLWRYPVDSSLVHTEQSQKTHPTNSLEKRLATCSFGSSSLRPRLPPTLTPFCCPTGRRCTSSTARTALRRRRRGPTRASRLARCPRPCPAWPAKGGRAFRKCGGCTAAATSSRWAAPSKCSSSGASPPTSGARSTWLLRRRSRPA